MLVTYRFCVQKAAKKNALRHGS